MFPNTIKKAQSTPTLELNSNGKVTPKQILKYIRSYKHKLRVLLEHLCRPLMDVVENNKIITDFVTSKKFYNKSNIIVRENDDKRKINRIKISIKKKSIKN